MLNAFAVMESFSMKIILVAVASISLTALAVSDAATHARQTQASRSVLEGVFTKEQVKRGEALYAQHCSSCHGPDLSGNDEAAALSGPAFIANWDGLTVGDLSERVRVSMPPNKQGKLSRQQIVDILSYVLNFNSFPDGKTELDPKAEVLKQIKIEASKTKGNSSL